MGNSWLRSPAGQRLCLRLREADPAFHPLLGGVARMIGALASGWGPVQRPAPLYRFARHARRTSLGAPSKARAAGWWALPAGPAS